MSSPRAVCPSLANGFFVPPTLLADVTPEMRVAQEEMFGPVVTITVFDTEDQAVENANAGRSQPVVSRLRRAARSLCHACLTAGGWVRL